MRTVYICDGVAAVQRLHQPVLAAYPSEWTVREALVRQADVLEKAHARGDVAASIQPSQWLPRCVGQSVSVIMATPLTFGEVRSTLALEHGFPDWAAVEDAGERPLGPAFESAVEAVLAGDVASLKALLARTPSLVDTRSAYGHQASLLRTSSPHPVLTE